MLLGDGHVTVSCHVFSREELGTPGSLTKGVFSALSVLSSTSHSNADDSVGVKVLKVLQRYSRQRQVQVIRG